MFGLVGIILWCACICRGSLGLSQTITSEGHFAVTDKYYDDGTVQSFVYANAQLLELVELQRGISEQQALLWCQFKCTSNPLCNSFVFNKSITFCYLTSFDRCANQQQFLVVSPGLRTYDVRLGSLPKPIRTCYSDCTGTCGQCGRLHCQGLECMDCAIYCWNEQVVNITQVKTTLWRDKAMSITIYVPCELGWQMIYGYFYTSVTPIFTVYAVPFTVPLMLRLAVVYKDASIRYSYFDTFTYEGLNTISVGSYLGGNAGNYWEAPFNNLTVVFNSSCPVFYPTSSTTCVAGSGTNSQFTWLTGTSAVDAIGVVEVQLWIIQKGMQWFDPQYVPVTTTG